MSTNNRTYIDFFDFIHSLLDMLEAIASGSPAVI